MNSELNWLEASSVRYHRTPAIDVKIVTISVMTLTKNEWNRQSGVH